MSRRTPLYERHAAAGARFVPFSGFEMPVWYSSLVEEHLAVRERVGLFDVSHMGEVRVKGPGAGAALDFLVTQRVSDLALGQARYTLMCNPEGGVVDDLIVYRIADQDFLVCVNAGNREKDFSWMVANNPREDATFTDEGDDWVQIAVQGPASERLLQALTPLDLGTVAYYHQAPGTVAGVEGCIVARTGYTGSPGFEIFVPAQGGVAVWDALMSEGVQHGVAPVGLGARDTLRLEARMPLYGHELTDTTSPGMAKLLRVCKFDKPGGFLGQAAVEARKATDTHVIAGAFLDGKRVVRDGMDVMHEGRKVGWVTSGTRSPLLDRGICLFYIESALAEAGTRVQFDVRGKLEEGVVHAGPFVPKPAAA